MQKYLNDITANEAAAVSTIVVLDTVSQGWLLRFFVHGVARPNPPPATSWADVPQAPANAGLGAVDVPVDLLGAAVSDAPEIQEVVFREVHRQYFAPMGADLSLGSAEKDDYTCVVLPVNAQTLAPGFPYAHFTEASTSKASVRRMARVRGEYAHLVFASMKADAPLDDWTLVRTTIPGLLFVDKTPGDWQPLAIGEDVFTFLPTISLSCPATVAAGDVCQVEVTVMKDGAPYDYSGELRVEMLSGYANRSRVPVVNGCGAFKVLPLGLEVGEDIRIKVGTKNVTGLASATVRVV